HRGDVVRVGAAGRRMKIVGVALLPATSHTDYDQSAWMNYTALTRALPTTSDLGSDFFEDYVLVRWRQGADVAAAQRRLGALGGGEYYTAPATLPNAVVSLGQQRTLPLALAAFF